MTEICSCILVKGKKRVGGDENNELASRSYLSSIVKSQFFSLVSNWKTKLKGDIKSHNDLEILGVVERRLNSKHVQYWTPIVIEGLWFP